MGLGMGSIKLTQRQSLNMFDKDFGMCPKCDKSITSSNMICEAEESDSCPMVNIILDSWHTPKVIVPEECATDSCSLPSKVRVEEKKGEKSLFEIMVESIK